MKSINPTQVDPIPAAYSPAAQTKRVEILIVDDSSFDTKNIERQCLRTSLYCAIDTATDVETMRQALDTKTYDVIFIDYHLASETGIEARKVICEHPKNGDTTTIMITGEVCHEVAVSAIKNGCQDYVAKSDLNSTALEMMLKTATKRLEDHATQVLQREMDAIHARTMGAVTEVVQQELSDERMVSLLLKALTQIGYADGRPYINAAPEAPNLLSEDDTDPNFFIFK
ncbi:response regulator receiver domain-containing protein [Pacificibacter maritimus]|uniref:Response regulator receiver domain-containing protein n=1 Tax=Pacificibacter maritimus TaxID=762213 RepID=A0A3N4U7L8_9RHOB|nr:response regulator [Pacificibacter maritimus]RPE66432.1 response regulator receiver domain-containing protein [Pacificibacter maritimus]